MLLKLAVTIAKKKEAQAGGPFWILEATYFSLLLSSLLKWGPGQKAADCLWSYLHYYCFYICVSIQAGVATSALLGLESLLTADVKLVSFYNHVSQFLIVCVWWVCETVYFPIIFYYSLYYFLYSNHKPILSHPVYLLLILFLWRTLIKTNHLFFFVLYCFFSFYKLK